MLRRFAMFVLAFLAAFPALAAVPQANWISGVYTIAAGPSQLPPAAPNAYYIAWVVDRPGSAGFMVSDGTVWTSDAGPKGDAGVDGNTILSGIGAPSSGLGKNGDFYVDLVASRMYGPKTSGVWGTGVSLVGATGSAGSAGAVGPTGPQGTTGTAGSAATIAVGSVSPLSAGSSPTVTNAGTSAAAVFNFGIPAGTTGGIGATGATGPTGSTPPLGTATPLADGTASAGTSTNAAREDHVHPALTVATSTPTRSLNTTFTPSATRSVWISYSITVSVTNPLLSGSSTATVILVSDTAATPTTERARVSNSSSVALTVTVQITQPQIMQISYLCPAGHNVRLNSSTSGTASISITSQTEVVVG